MEFPCEHILWYIVPVIRKEFAKSLMNKHGLNQKQAAKLLGVTPAAVCQYLSSKRGSNDIVDKKILKEIENSSTNIIKKGSEKVSIETCRICNLMRSAEKELLTGIKGKDILCEVAFWCILPILRKEIAKNLIEDHGFTQRKAADKLGINEASVSRYISGIRGNKEINDDNIIREIKESTDKIVEGDDSVVVAEICRICNLLKTSDFIKGINYACK